jgi:hypothetical protein
MSADRRTFLRASLGAGALALAAASGFPQACLRTRAANRSRKAVERPLLLLRSADDELFAQSILQTSRQVGATSVIEVALDAANVSAPGALLAALSPHRGTSVLGLMDDFTHCLVEEALRDLGGAVVCRGYHRGPLGSLAASRHAFVSTNASQGIGSTLAAALERCDADFRIEEQSSGYDSARWTALTEPAPWTRVLGGAYARMALGLWEPAPVRTLHGRGIAAVYPSAHSTASIVARL